jgi:E3 ubiquitin-protein ligase TRIP12
MRLVGLLVGKALLDGQLLDLPLAPQLLQNLVHRTPLALKDLVAVKPDLGQRMLELDALVKQRNAILADSSLNDLQRSMALNSLRYHGGRIEALELDFATPLLLKEGGGQIAVTLDNLEEYVNLVKDAFLGAGVAQQIDTIREGFEQYISVESLKTFTASEIDELICGVVEGASWTKAELRANTKVAEKIKDRVSEFFFEILSEFDVRERRQFLLFLTGCPRLPAGGWRALEPKMQLQPKDGASEASLPSVNTCFIFLKMPEYSSKEIMHQRILYAMFNGVDRFDLS